MRPVKRADAPQPADDVGQVRPKDAAVGVDFVDDDVAQVLKELDPLGVVRQDAGVEHVRVGEHDVPGQAHGVARVHRRIPVVGEGLDLHAHVRDERVDLRELVRGPGL